MDCHAADWKSTQIRLRLRFHHGFYILKKWGMIHFHESKETFYYEEIPSLELLRED